MTPKEKAKELVSKMERPMDGVSIFRLAAKKLALIAVDMVIKCCKDYDEVHENYTTQVNYWEQVKNEIEQL
jgi:hypothetical protein